MTAAVSAQAATPSEANNYDLTTLQVSENQIVQVLPEGGFIYNADGSSDVDLSVVKSNNRIVMPYRDYLKLEQKDASVGFVTLPPVFRSASPHKASQTAKILVDGEVYTSNFFSGSGWRFSELKFRPSHGTGSYLRWTSIGDSALVGSEYQAFHTWQTGVGTSMAVLGNGETRWVDTTGGWSVFYTYNPARGPQYVVANI